MKKRGISICAGAGVADLRRATWPIMVIFALTAGPAAQNNPVGKYNGPGGCASSSCHGSIQPRQVTRVAQNEYSIWAGQDKHARAYQVLSSRVSLRIGKILNIGRPDQSPKCLACHALSVAAEQRAQTFELDDGVSCESCHGPASGWLGPHTTRDWPHEKSLQLGMYDTRDLVKRSERCLSCHLGNPEKSVDHEMIAAGHPDLTFELNLFSAVMPRHWKVENGDSTRDAQAWAVGEAVQLRENLNRLARRAGGSTWPEYAELDCFACHHSLTKPEDSWRQAQGYSGRKPGVPAWNASRYVVLRHAVRAVNAETADQLDKVVAKLAAAMVQPDSNREEIAATAAQAAALAASAVRQLNIEPFHPTLILQTMRNIAADGGAISAQGQRTAELAAMSLDSLFVAYQPQLRDSDAKEIRAAINGLFEQVDDPSAYNAPRFAAQMQKVSALLAHVGSAEKASR